MFLNYFNDILRLATEAPTLKARLLAVNLLGSLFAEKPHLFELPGGAELWAKLGEWREDLGRALHNVPAPAPDIQSGPIELVVMNHSLPPTESSERRKALAPDPALVLSHLCCCNCADPGSPTIAETDVGNH